MAGHKKDLPDPRKSIFISEILSGKSGVQAAISAGFSKKNAARQAHRLRSDPAISAEIEIGLKALRDGASVSAESMIAQFDADRLFAIKTANASAATRASEMKAKLVGLMIERKDVRAAHHVRTDGPPVSSRDLALAVMAVLQDAGSPPKDRATPVSTLLPADASEAPAAERSAVGASLGENHEFENGSTIIFISIEGSGQKTWAIYDHRDVHHSYRRRRSTAEKVAKALPGPK